MKKKAGMLKGNEMEQATKLDVTVSNVGGENHVS